MLDLNIRNRRFAAKKGRRTKNGTEFPGDGPPLPRAPGKKIRRSGETPHSDFLEKTIYYKKYFSNKMYFLYETGPPPPRVP